MIHRDSENSSLHRFKLCILWLRLLLVIVISRDIKQFVMLQFKNAVRLKVNKS
jgi:hypothetical protein